MSDINDQHQQQQQQQPPPTSAQTAGVGTAIPNVNLGGPTPAPAQPQLQPLTIDPNSAGPPGGQPGNTLAAWAAPHSLLHAEGTAAVAAMQQSAIATLIEGPNQFWSSYYFYDMYRCRDEADEDAGSLMSTDHVVASSASHPGVPLPAPSPTEARLRLGDLTKLLYLIARVQDEAAEQGVPYEQVAPRPRWIPHNIANVKMLVKRFGDQHATNQLNRLVLSQAKKALKKLQKMKRVGGPQQQQAEGGGTGGVEGGNSAGGSEGTGNDDGGGT